MIGRRVATRVYRNNVGGDETGVVVEWQPLGPALTDALVRFEDGYECWYGSHELKPVDGLGPLPSRAGAQKAADAVAVRQLRSIRAAHVRNFGEPWPGLEFGKVLFGQALDGALEELEGKKT